jgi:hypothetical protein
MGRQDLREARIPNSSDRGSMLEVGTECGQGPPYVFVGVASKRLRDHVSALESTLTGTY